MTPILVTSYVNPDLDGTACAVAYVEYLQKNGKDAVVGLIGELSSEAKYIFERFGFEYPMLLTDASEFSKVILVDVSDLYGLEGHILPEKVIEIIDHRKIHEADKFPNAKLQIELVGSASTLIAEKYLESDTEISKKSAILLASAIISNTFNFKGKVTTERDKAVFQWLNKTAELADNYWLELFSAKSDLTGDKLFKQIEDDIYEYNLAGKKTCIAQVEMIGAMDLMNSRKEEIFFILKKIKTKLNLDIIFLSLIDLKDEFNIFFANEESTQHILHEILDIEFKNNIAIRPGLIIRKEISPLLKNYLENTQTI